MSDDMLSYYRWRFSNWLMAKPWTWHYRAIYRQLRLRQVNPFTGRVYHEQYGRIRAAWLALTFPHVHEDEE